MDFKTLIGIVSIFVAIQGVLISIYALWSKSLRNQINDLRKIIEDKFKNYEKYFNNELKHMNEDIKDIKKKVDDILEELLEHTLTSINPKKK